jgi:hypothetical protein
MRVQSFGLTVNTVPVCIEGVLVCGRFDEWRAESFAVQRVTKATYSCGRRRGRAWTTSRCNQVKAREVILDVVREWAGAPPPKQQTPIVAAESNDGLLAELLA